MTTSKQPPSRTKYPSDISRDQFRVIEPVLVSARKITKPCQIDLYEVFCGVLYVLKSGCQWDNGVLHTTTGRYGMREMDTGEVITHPSVLERVLKKLVGEARIHHGRLSTTSFLIIDAQSVINTSSAGEKGYDAEKKVSGIKRHIAVDSHALLVTTANINDKADALEMIKGEHSKCYEYTCRWRL